MRVAKKIILTSVIPFVLSLVVLFLAICCLTFFLKNNEISDNFYRVLFMIFSIIALFWSAGAVFFVWYVWKNIVTPLKTAEKYAARLANGESTVPLSLMNLSNDELRSLYSSLNFIRDKQQSMNSKLKAGVMREANIRHEVERYDTLQLYLLSHSLPENRRNLGVIKAFVMAGKYARETGVTDNFEWMSKLLRKIASFSCDIEELFDLSRLDRTRWQNPRFSAFSAGQTMRDLINRCSIPLRSRDVLLEIQYSGGVPGRLYWDKELLFQMMNILIRSLGRATGKGGKVVFTRGYEDSKVYFELRSSRAVPCNENLADIFAEMVDGCDERFAYDCEYGTGAIGLGIVRDVASSLGCRLDVSSDEENFTILRLTLPTTVAMVGERDIEEFGDNIMQLPESNESKSKISPNQLRALLITSDSVEGEAYAYALKHGNIFCEVQDWQSDISARTEDFDAVIVMEPNCDPDEMPDELRRISGKRNLPVVVIASLFTEEEFRKFINHERVWCMNMPIDFELLCDILHRATDK